MGRIIKVDVQRRKEVRGDPPDERAPERDRRESVKRTGREPAGPVVRLFALPASEERVASAEAEEAREQGTPPL
jgi:hypothetical protein